MIRSYSLHSHDGGAEGHPANVGCSNFRYIKNAQSNNKSKRCQKKNKVEQTAKSTAISKVSQHKETKGKVS